MSNIVASTHVISYICRQIIIQLRFCFIITLCIETQEELQLTESSQLQQLQSPLPPPTMRVSNTDLYLPVQVPTSINFTQYSQ